MKSNEWDSTKCIVDLSHFGNGDFARTAGGRLNATYTVDYIDCTYFFKFSDDFLSILFPDREVLVRSLVLRGEIVTYISYKMYANPSSCTYILPFSEENPLFLSQEGKIVTVLSNREAILKKSRQWIRMRALGKNILVLFCWCGIFLTKLCSKLPKAIRPASRYLRSPFVGLELSERLSSIVMPLISIWKRYMHLIDSASNFTIELFVSQLNANIHAHAHIKL